MVQPSQPLSSRRNESLGVATLLLVTLVWGTTFLVMARCLTTCTAAWLMTLRFAIAAVSLAPFAWRARRQLRAALRPGAWLALLAFLGFMLQVKSLRYTTQAHCAFGTSLVTVFVPLLAAVVLRRALRPGTVLALSCAVLGMMALVGAEMLAPIAGNVTFTLQSMLLGDLLAVASAAGFAAQILAIEHYARRCSLVALVFVEVLGVSVLSFVTATSSHEPFNSLSGGAWLRMAYLGVAATALCLVGQMFGQARTTATRAAFIYALEPAVAATLAWAVDGQRLAPMELCGGLLMTFAAIVAERSTPPLWRRARRG